MPEILLSNDLGVSVYAKEEVKGRTYLRQRILGASVFR